MDNRHDNPFVINTILEVTDGRGVTAGVSVTWNILSRSGGHEFEPLSS